jgi:hypothetical protein
MRLAIRTASFSKDTSAPIAKHGPWMLGMGLRA